MGKVRILETFEVVQQLGPLVVRTVNGEEDVIDGPREYRHTYTAGGIQRFVTKQAASDFVAKHPGKAELA